jgi:hypothetical protein
MLRYILTNNNPHDPERQYLDPHFQARWIPQGAQ